MEKYHYEKTNYPNIFKNTYWGHFRVSNNVEFKTIYENRNKFIEEYNINKIKKRTYVLEKKIYNDFVLGNLVVDKKILSSREKFSYIYNLCNDILDHIETYQTKDKKILFLFSPYYISEENKEKLFNIGYKQIYDLYCKGANTFIKIY